MSRHWPLNCVPIFTNGYRWYDRWMSKAIYTLKLTLLKHQFLKLPWHKKQKLDKMTFFILFVYLESWFRSSSLFTAACDDLKLHQRLLKFRHIHKKLANVGLKVLQRHTWYFTQELDPMCSFNNNIFEDMKNKIAEKISNLPVDNLSIQKPVMPTISFKSVHCTLYIVHCKLHNVHCTINNVQSCAISIRHSRILFFFPIENF